MLAVATESSNIRERLSDAEVEVGLVELTSNSRSDDDDGPKEKSGSSRSKLYRQRLYTRVPPTGT